MIPEKLYIEYETENGSYTLSEDISSLEEKNQETALKLQILHKNGRLSLAVYPDQKVILKQVKITGKIETPRKKKTRYFLNGWQSWTDSREYSSSETEKTVGKMPAFINKQFGFESYGDYTFCGPKLKKGCFHGWTYAYVKLGEDYEFVGSLSEVNAKEKSLFSDAEPSWAFSLIKFFTKENRFELYADSDRMEYEISEPQVLMDVVFLSGTESGVFDTYFGISGIEKPSVNPVMGWTSWYDYYQNINQNCLLESIEGISSANQKRENAFKVFQIDDGYEPFVGDWLSVDSEKFPQGLEPIVSRAREAGLETGIWFAPFSAEKKSRLFKDHPDWFCKAPLKKNPDREKPVLCGCNWSGFYALDIYNQDVKDYIIRSCRHFIDDLGFSLLKIDFLYSVCLVPHKDKTRGKVMHDAMEFFRSASRGAKLLGCGVPLGSAFGLVDYCRIGTDVSLTWNDKLYMQLCHRERPSTKNTILNSLYRRQLDGRAFLNDPDVFLLRDYNEKLGNQRKKLLSVINALTGSLVFTSDNPAVYENEQNEILDKIIKLQKSRIISVENKGSKVFVKYDPLDGQNGEQILRFNCKNGKIF